MKHIPRIIELHIYYSSFLQRAMGTHLRGFLGLTFDLH